MHSAAIATAWWCLFAMLIRGGSAMERSKSSYHRPFFPVRDDSATWLAHGTFRAPPAGHWTVAPVWRRRPAAVFRHRLEGRLKTISNRHRTWPDVDAVHDKNVHWPALKRDGFMLHHKEINRGHHHRVHFGTIPAEAPLMDMMALR